MNYLGKHLAYASSFAESIGRQSLYAQSEDGHKFKHIDNLLFWPVRAQLEGQLFNRLLSRK